MLVGSTLRQNKTSLVLTAIYVGLNIIKKVRATTIRVINPYSKETVISVADSLVAFLYFLRMNISLIKTSEINIGYVRIIQRSEWLYPTDVITRFPVIKDRTLIDDNRIRLILSCFDGNAKTLVKVPCKVTYTIINAVITCKNKAILYICGPRFLEIQL